MDKPSPRELREATGISQSYASMILSENPDKARTPPRSLAIHILRCTGWKHALLADLTDAQIDVLEQVEPWSAPTRHAGQAA